jgi:hypothetical protein
VTLPELGSLVYGCDSSGRRVAVALDNGPAPHTGATVTVEGDHGIHLRTTSTSTGPGTATRTTAFGSYHSLTWRIILTEEPRSLVATVRIHFGGCVLTTWSVAGQVIEHDHKWSNPPAWA